MNFSFAGKIYSAIGVVIAIMCVNALLSYAALDRALAGYNRILEQESLAIQKLYEISVKIGSAKEAENRFAISLDENLAQQHRIATDSMSRTAGELGALWAAMGVAGADNDKAKLMEAISGYRNSFDTLAKDLALKGKDDRGLVGEFRKSVHELEALLEGANALEIERDLLMLRRHEKDYLMRKEKKYVDKVLSQLETMKASCARILPAEKAAKAADLLAGYSEKFMQVAGIEETAAGASKRLAQIEESMALLISGKLTEEQTRLETGRKKVQEDGSSAKTLTLVFSACGILAGFLLSILIVRAVIGPLTSAAPVIQRIARGDFTQSVNVSSEDEIGNLARSINVMAGNLRQTMASINQNARDLAESSRQMAEVASHMADGSGDMKSQANAVAVATEELSANITAMAASVEEISVNVSAISSGAERTSSNMNTVSASVEQMTASIDSIAKGAANAGSVAGKASSLSNKASDTMKSLGDAARKIGEVTGVIKRIAEQTNLLALNATIEAASAGAAGKGFAVVANEIKELANQSAAAAEDIASRIGGVQDNAREAVQVMGEISSVIGAINNAVESINISVREQNQVASGIAGAVGQAADDAGGIAKSIAELAKGANSVARNAGEAAKGLNDIAKSLNMVNQAAGDQSAGAQQVSESSGSLKRIAGEMEESLKQFKVA